MDRLALRAIIDGANEIQKECKKHFNCRTCFFYADKNKNTNCQLHAYIVDGVGVNFEDFGKNLSLQYLK